MMPLLICYTTKSSETKEAFLRYLINKKINESKIIKINYRILKSTV